MSYSVPNPALLSDMAELLLSEEAVARDLLATGQKPGAVTGFPTLDKEIGEFLAPGLHTLLAAPGAGKTALALQISAQSGCPCLYVSSEMRRVELLRRLIAQTTNTYLGKLRGGQKSAGDLQELIHRAGIACPQLALYDATEGNIDGATGSERIASASHIEKVADGLRQRFGAPHVLIVVDSITDWAQSAFIGTETQRGMMGDLAIAESALTSLDKIAKSLNCAIIGIAHRHRAGQGKDADRLHAAKGTGRFEYVSQSVWDLERDPRQEPDENGQTKAELSILKNRFGGTGYTIKLKFEGRLQLFKEVA